MIVNASVVNRQGVYFVDWTTILGGGIASVPCKNFDDAVKYSRSLPDVTISIDCPVPESMTPETWSFIQEVQA